MSIQRATIIAIAFVVGLLSRMAAAQVPVGQWDFSHESTALNATIGSSLTLSGAHTFIPGIGGVGGAVRIGPGSYYSCAHGIASNGGGTRVNMYTLLVDFRVPTTDPLKRYCFFQTDPANSGNGAFFIEETEGHFGVEDLSYSGPVATPDTWNRLVIVYNLDQVTGTSVAVYLNGTQIDGPAGAPGALLDSRFSLGPTVLFFADNDGGDGLIDVSRVALYDGLLSEAEVAALGGPEENIAPAPLAFTQQPVGGTICVGEPKSFSVEISGGTPPYHYEWRRNGATVGADSAQYAIGTATFADAGAYVCAVTDSAARKIAGTATSDEVTLVVVPAEVLSLVSWTGLAVAAMVVCLGIRRCGKAAIK